MITVHHLNNSRSQRILWMLEELEVPYDIKPYTREASMQAPAALRAVHPLGKSPVITDGDKVLGSGCTTPIFCTTPTAGLQAHPRAGGPYELMS